jgi:quercetin dioxygenase-like cupin family protein
MSESAEFAGVRASALTRRRDCSSHDATFAVEVVLVSKRLQNSLWRVGLFSMFQYVALSAEKSWQPGPYPGVELLVLHKNEITGGVTVLRKFHAGMTIPAHTHRHANESVYVLSGEWEESGIVYTTGAFFFAPKGERHGPHIARTEVISLTVFDGPLTVE